MIKPAIEVAGFFVEYAALLYVFFRWHQSLLPGIQITERTMNFENRIFALERSLDRQRKITTGLLCLLFAVLGMGATSVVKETVEVTNGGFGRPLKVVLVNGTSSGSPYYKVE